MDDPENEIKLPVRGPPPQTSPENQNQQKTAGNTILADPEAGNENSNERPMTLRHFLALAALAFMWSGAQAPLFLFAAVPLYIYKDIGGSDHWIWLASANLLATAAISPFVGALSDIFGRRYIAIAGSAFIITGQIMCCFAPSMDVFIAGMAVSGIGTGISELTVLAGVADIVPVSKRGYYTAGVVLSVAPFIPSVMWAQLIAYHSTWRNIAIVTSAWSGIALFLTGFCYSPPPPPPEASGIPGPSLWHRLRNLDWIGGITSFVGLICLELGLLSGGYNASWKSAQVLVPLCFGVFCLFVFMVWERSATNPILPETLGKAPRTMVLTLIITFISGANFFAVLMLWPSEAYNVYDHSPIGIGLRGLPFACGTFVGCIISLLLLSKFPGHIKWLLFGSSILMTAGCGALAAAKVDNISIVYFILSLAGLGVGGIVVPASTLTTIICPEGLLATITALTISIRIVGGAIGYAVYFNVFVNKLVPKLSENLARACLSIGITNPELIEKIIKLTGESQIDEIKHLPGVTDSAWELIVAAGRETYAGAYRWVYYCSIAFGATSALASLFLQDISEYIDDTVLVRY